jgi:hypothetical protein
LTGLRRHRRPAEGHRLAREPGHQIHPRRNRQGAPTCDNTLGMPGAAKAISTVLLSALALASATFGVYSLSIARAGHWAYPELVAPICGQMVAAILALGVIAFINRRRRGIGAVVRLAALLAVGCFTAAGGVYFGLLSNCSLSCGNKIVVESTSPDGKWKAVVFSRNCVAIAGFCPETSHVSIVAASEEFSGSKGNAFSIVGDGVDLRWQSDDLLSVRYSGRVLRRQTRVRDIRVDYLPIGIM